MKLTRKQLQNLIKESISSLNEGRQLDALKKLNDVSAFLQMGDDATNANKAAGQLIDIIQPFATGQQSYDQFEKLLYTRWESIKKTYPEAPPEEQ